MTRLSGVWFLSVLMIIILVGCGRNEELPEEEVSIESEATQPEENTFARWTSANAMT